MLLGMVSAGELFDLVSPIDSPAESGLWGNALAQVSQCSSVLRGGAAELAATDPLFWCGGDAFTADGTSPTFQETGSGAVGGLGSARSWPSTGSGTTSSLTDVLSAEVAPCDDPLESDARRCRW